MTKLDTSEDALPLLAYKIAPRQFDLSYRFSNISLRDQIVRAQTLVRTLFDTGLVYANAIENEAEFELLICGAGAAGLAAAKEAEALKISFVLIEKGSDVPGGVLMSKAQRYVSAAMYEWPHPNHTQHAFPLLVPALLGKDVAPLPSLKLSFAKPVLIASFGRQLREKLRKDTERWVNNAAKFISGVTLRNRRLLFTETTLSATSKLALREMLNHKVSIHGVPLCDADLPDIEFDCKDVKFAGQKFRFQFVIYAVGFAKEATTYAEKKLPFKAFDPTPFWDLDTIFQPRLGLPFPRPSVAILGAGDGALQDALRCMVTEKFPHPLAIWEGLLECHQNKKRRLIHSPHVIRALAKLAAADCYTTGGAIWTSHGHIFKSLDVAFNAIIDELIKREGAKLRHAVGAMIRSDVAQVTIVTQHGYFSKSYALNRFLVLLFHKVLPTLCSAHAVKLELLAGEVTLFEQLPSNPRGAKLGIGTVSSNRVYDLVLIRGGLNKAEAPTQLIGLSGLDTGRAGLGRIPSPIRTISVDI